MSKRSRTTNLTSSAIHSLYPKGKLSHFPEKGAKFLDQQGKTWMFDKYAGFSCWLMVDEEGVKKRMSPEFLTKSC